MLYFVVFLSIWKKGEHSEIVETRAFVFVKPVSKGSAKKG